MCRVKQIKRQVVGGLLLVLLIGFIVAVPTLPLISAKPVSASFLAPVKANKAVVFFGFRSCNKVCPITLSTLANVINRFQSDGLDTTEQTNLPQVIFVDIDSASDDDSALKFAQQYHPSFIGLHVSMAQLDYFSAQFGLNINNQNGVLTHQGRSYLLTRVDNERWILIKTFNPSGLTYQALQAALSQGQ